MNFVTLILMRRCLLGSGILLILLGCGKKGPPIPYDVTVPQSISDLEGVVREGRVFLRWSMPRQASDKPEVAGVREFHVLREEARFEGERCEECPERLKRFDVLRMDKMDNFSLVGDRVVYQDRRVSYGHVYLYRVISVSARGYESDPSNRAMIYWDIPPAAPGRIEGTAGDGVANLQWKPVDGAEGYRIYRKQEGSEFGDAPIGALGTNEISYRDTGLSNELVYHYVLRAGRRVGRTWVEGPSSEEISLIPRDLTPPGPPQGLVAIPLAVGIELSWQRNTEPDLLGYLVYRRDWEGGEYRSLNEYPLKAPIYIDRTVILGKRYEYVVTAVDRSAQRNESAFSEPVRLVHVR